MKREQLLAVVGIGALGIGLAIGSFLLGPATKGVGTRGTAGPCGVRPGELPGRHCDVPCGDQTECVILDRIQCLADADLWTGQVTPAQFHRVHKALYNCALRGHDYPGPVLDPVAHCNALTMARTHAENHEWDLCIQQLEHGH